MVSGMKCVAITEQVLPSSDLAGGHGDDFVSNDGIAAPAKQFTGASRVIDCPYSQAEAGIAHLLNDFPSEITVVQIQATALKPPDAFAPVGRQFLFDQQCAWQFGHGIPCGGQGLLGKGREQGGKVGAFPELFRQQCYALTGVGFHSGGWFDLYIAMYTVGAGVSSDAVQGGNGFAGIFSGMPCSEIMTGEFGEAEICRTTTACGGSIQRVVMQQDRDVVSRELDVILHHSKTM